MLLTSRPGPFSPAHVHLGVVYPERLDLNDDMARLWLGVRERLLITKPSGPPNFCMTIARMSNLPD